MFSNTTIVRVSPTNLPAMLTQRQLSFWQRMEAMGAMARAVVVMAAGIQEASCKNRLY